MPFTTIATSTAKSAPLYSPLCPGKPYPSDKYKPNYVTGGIYTQWDDGNNPIFRNNNICLTTSWVQSELQFEPGTCQRALNENKPLEIYYLHRYFWRASSGWKMDDTYANRYRVDGFCNATKSSPSSPWVVTGEEYKSNIWLKFVNQGMLGIALGERGFPTCANAVYTTYEPNAITVERFGKLSAQVNTYWSGQKTFCGEWLRTFNKLFKS